MLLRARIAESCESAKAKQNGRRVRAVIAAIGNWTVCWASRVKRPGPVRQCIGLLYEPPPIGDEYSDNEPVFEIPLWRVYDETPWAEIHDRMPEGYWEQRP